MAPKQKQAKLVFGDTVASSGLSVRTFSLSQPLLTVENGVVDKFNVDPEAEGVDTGVANIIFRRIIKKMQLTASCFSLSGQIPTELRYRIVCANFLPVLTQLAPRQGERIGGEPGPGKEVKVRAGFRLPESGFDHGQVADGGQVAEVNDETASCSSLLSGLSISRPSFQHEDSTGLRSHEKIDFRGTCFDLQLGTDVPVLMIDAKGRCSWTAEDGAFYQVASYGSRAAIENLKLGRFNKVHCLALGLGWWGVTQINPVGYVEVLNGTIAPGSAVKLKAMLDAKHKLLERKNKKDEIEALAKDYAWVNNISDAGLLQKFQMTMQFDARKLNSMVIDGSVKYEPCFKQDFVELLIGKVTVDENLHDMMEFPLCLDSRSSHLVPGDYVLLSGMMRCLYGNRALTWTTEGVSNLIKSRKVELNAQVDDVIERGKRLAQRWLR